MCDCVTPLQPSHLFDGFHGLPDQGGVLALVLLLTERSKALSAALSLPLLPQTHTLGLLLLEVCLAPSGDRYTGKKKACDPLADNSLLHRIDC